MPLRVRRSVKIAPGVKMNLSKRGASVSVGTKGATTNVSKSGARSTVGVPGTGVSYTTSNKKGCGTKAALFLIVLAVVIAWLV